MNVNSTRHATVESGGEGVVAHVGLHALGRFADRLQLGSLLSSRIIPRGERLPMHDRGKVFTQMALVLAGGGESCRDIEHLRAQVPLFKDVPSDSTVQRTMHEFAASDRSELSAVLAVVREKVWNRLGLVTSSEPVLLDIDATLVEIHSENKQSTAPNYKHGFGFHPMFCFADATGEALSSMLRAGNAGSNTITDHVRLLDEAIGQLPERIARGHHVGDEAEPAREVIVRTDGAGCTHGFLDACRARHVGFFTTAIVNSQIEGAIYEARSIEGLWEPARRQDGEPRDGAAVAELSELVDLRDFPAGTRLIVRREPRHPGAQRSLFFELDYRYVGFYTDRDGEPVALDQMMRAHAHVERHIERLKDSGLTTMPFLSFEANATWMMTVALSADLVRWFQLLCFEGDWRDARPKSLRWRLFHAPGQLVRRSRQLLVRVAKSWPESEVILLAYRRIALLT